MNFFRRLYQACTRMNLEYRRKHALSEAHHYKRKGDHEQAQEYREIAQMAERELEAMGDGECEAMDGPSPMPGSLFGRK